MKHCWTFLISIILCANICAQNYSTEVSLVQQDNNSVTILSTAVGDKKKDAALLAAKSAFHTLFHSGVEGVKNGVPMVAAEQKDFDYRFFNESRYINFIGSEIETVNDSKIGGKYRVTVKLTIQLKTLLADLTRNNLKISPGWSDAKAVKATAALNPTIVVVPDTKGNGSDAEAMRQQIINDPVMEHLIMKLTEEFSKHGYKTKNFISQLQNAKNSALLRAESGAQSDATTDFVRNLQADIVVTASLNLNTNSATNKGECSINLSAVEFQTQGNLANKSFASGQYMTTNGIMLTDHAVQKMQADFFSQLQAAFEKMVAEGREVAIELNLSETVTEWDFSQASPATGKPFKRALDSWIREHSFQNVYNMDYSTNKYIKLSVNVPLWDQENNSSYNINNFGDDLNTFLQSQFGSDYTTDIVAMGQGMNITIK